MNTIARKNIATTDEFLSAGFTHERTGVEATYTLRTVERDGTFAGCVLFSPFGRRLGEYKTRAAALRRFEKETSK